MPTTPLTAYLSVPHESVPRLLVSVVGGELPAAFVPAVVLADANGVVLPGPGVGNGVTYTLEIDGTIAAGGAAQPVNAGNANRRALAVQNTSSGDLRVRFTGAAGASAGIRLTPGQLYEAPAHAIPLGTVSIWGATTGQTFYYAEA